MKISMKKKTMHVFSKSATQKSDVRYKKEKKTPLSKKLRIALTVLQQSDVYNKQEKFEKKD